MKYNILLLLLSIIFCQCASESKDNNSVALETPELLYLNHFTSKDTAFWVGDDGNNYAELDHGYYYFESMDSSIRYNMPSFPITNSDNFSVEIAIIGPTEVEDSVFYGLALGEFPPNKEIITLLVNNVGQYKIKTNYDISSGTFHDGFTGDMKKLKLLKKELTTYFYINDQPVFNYVFDTLEQFRCGPITSYAIWMDYIKIEKEAQNKQ